ncbi:helix-turn-helix transcriptional regulator [Bosea sp. (in: a-proteobacteria)]|uniref:helix-turn-helix domain-containing protein n=1 Tax=Bosea sp. (in: a-proteobacteria) TaxID=1871050 RepID=UPI00345DF6CE
MSFRHERRYRYIDPGLPCRATRPAQMRMAIPKADVFFDPESDFEQKLATLSPAQLQVLTLITSGYLNKQIAAMRGLAEATIKAHLSEILRRLEVRSRTQAAVKFAIYCERMRTQRDCVAAS